MERTYRVPYKQRGADGLFVELFVEQYNTRKLSGGKPMGRSAVSRVCADRARK